MFEPGAAAITIYGSQVEIVSQDGEYYKVYSLLTDKTYSIHHTDLEVK